MVNFGKMHLFVKSELEDFLKKLYSKHPHFFTEQMFADLKKIVPCIVQNVYHFEFIATYFFVTGMCTIPHVYVVDQLLVAA